MHVFIRCPRDIASGRHDTQALVRQAFLGAGDFLLHPLAHLRDFAIGDVPDFLHQVLHIGNQVCEVRTATR